MKECQCRKVRASLIPVEFDLERTCNNGYVHDAAHDELKAVGYMEMVTHDHPALEGVVHSSAACTAFVSSWHNAAGGRRRWG